jgi:hypothetical protein
MPTPDQENRHVSIKEILFLPFGCLFQISGLTLFSIIGVIAIIFLWIFFGVNTDMGGIFAPVLPSSIILVKIKLSAQTMVTPGK